MQIQYHRFCYDKDNFQSFDKLSHNTIKIMYFSNFLSFQDMLRVA